MKPEQIAFARLVKVDEEKRLVYGRAVQEVVDRVGEIFDYDSSKPLFQKWSKSQLEASMGKSAGNVRAMHKDVAAGVLIPEGGIVFHDDERAIDVCAKVTDDAEWQKVLTGTYTGYSIGGSYAKKWEDKELKRTRYTGDPAEISLVDRPAVPTATFFEIQKRDGSIEAKPFKQPREAMVKYLVERGQKADILAKAPDDDISERYVEAITVERLEALRKGEKAKQQEPKKIVLVLDGKDLGKTVADPKVDDEVELDGKRYRVAKVEGGKAVIALAKKDDDEPAGADVDGSQEEVAAFSKLLAEHGLSIVDATKLVKRGIPNAEPEDVEVEAVARALCEADGKKADDAGADKEPLWKGYIARAATEVRKVKAREDVDPKAGKQKYGNVKFADEKNKKYPIDTEDHIRAAWNYINKDKNAAKYSAEDVKAIKAKIVAAWKSKIDKDGPPSADDKSKKAAEAALQKVLAGVARAAKVDLAKATDEQKATLAKSADRAALRKGLYTASAFCQLLDSLCNLAESVEYEAYREGDDSEVCDQIYAGIQVLGRALTAMVAEEVAEATGGDDKDYAAAAMAAHQAADGLVKRLTGMAKAEPHLVVKQSHLQKAHDYVVKLGGSCDGMDKVQSAALLKAHVAVAQEGLDKLHKMLSKMGASCDQASGDGDDEDEAKKAARVALKKAFPTLEDKQIDELLAKAAPANEPASPLEKAIAAAVEPLQKQLEAANTEIGKLKAEPRAPKGRLLAVEKGDDLSGSSGGRIEAPKAVLKDDGSVDVEKTALEMTKWAQSHGRPLVAMDK